MVEFEWDPTKSKETEKKRGLSFADAEKVWDDLDLLIVPARTEKDEPRWAAIGKINGKVHTVIFTKRDGKTRIISARRARKEEREKYEGK